MSFLKQSASWCASLMFKIIKDSAFLLFDIAFLAFASVFEISPDKISLSAVSPANEIFFEYDSHQAKYEGTTQRVSFYAWFCLLPGRDKNLQYSTQYNNPRRGIRYKEYRLKLKKKNTRVRNIYKIKPPQKFYLPLHRTRAFALKRGKKIKTFWIRGENFIKKRDLSG